MFLVLFVFLFIKIVLKFVGNGSGLIYEYDGILVSNIIYVLFVEKEYKLFLLN